MMIKIKSHIKVLGLLVALFFSFSLSSFAGGKEKWQEGTASIGTNSNQNCPTGTSETHRMNGGCTHAVCTAAKNQAAANLRNKYQVCSKYIGHTGRCRNGPGCRK